MTAEQVHGLLIVLAGFGILAGLLTIAALCVAAARPRPTRNDQP